MPFERADSKRRVCRCSGFIELQINGAFGSDFTTSRHYLAVASLLPGMASRHFSRHCQFAPESVDMARMSSVKARPKVQGCTPLGPLEGPFLNPASEARTTRRPRLPDKRRFKAGSG